MKLKKAGFHLSLTTTLAISFFLLCVVVLVVAGGILIFSYYQTQQEALAGKLQVIVGNVSRTVSNFIQEKVNIFEAIIRTTKFSRRSSSERIQILDSLLGIQSSCRQIVVVNSDNQILGRASRLSRTLAEEFSASMLKDIKKIRTTSRSISGIYLDPKTGEPQITIAVHDRTSSNDIKETLVSEINLKFMWDLLEHLKVGTTGYAFVVDRGGHLIAFKDSSRVLKGENLARLKTVGDFIRNTANPEVSGISTYEGIQGTAVVGLYVPLTSPDWAVVTEIPVGEAYAEVTRNTFTSVIVMGAMSILAGISGIFLARRLAVPLVNLTRTTTLIAEGDMKLEAAIEGSKEVTSLARAFNLMTGQLRRKAESFQRTSQILSEIISKAKEIILNLNSAAQEIKASSQEQTVGANEHASGTTEVSATLQELMVTAKQIAKNTDELVFSMEEVVTLLQEIEKELVQTVSQIEEVGTISGQNAHDIGELGKRSQIINEMVELIKEVANKTNILSINASIESSRSGEAGTGFSVVAAEIRELSKETITSAKQAEVAAREIRDYLQGIIASSENEFAKVIESGKTVRSIFDKIKNAIAKINNDYSFTQKIDLSIKQQETGSIQAAETMKQMAEIARQSAETARQSLSAALNIASYGAELEEKVTKFNLAEEEKALL